MQKKLIALAVAGLVSGAAFAQSNVTIYGVVDATFDSVGAESAKAGSASDFSRRSRVNSNSSYIGFKGTESLGNGLAVAWQVENGVSLDNGNATGSSWNTRDSYVGIAGGFGTVAMGNLTGPTRALATKFDVNAGATGIGSNQALLGKGALQTAGASAFDQRLTNAIAYISPNFSGFSGVIGYTTGLTNSPLTGRDTAGVGDTAKGNTAWTIGLSYDQGPIYVGFAYTDVKATNDGATAADGLVAGVKKAEDTRLGAVYNFGQGTIGVLWDQSKYSATAGGDSKTNVYFIPFTFNVGTGKIIAQYGHAGNISGTSNTGAKMFEVGYEYSLSKRTIVKALYSSISNEENATYDFLYGVSQPNSTGTGAGVSAGADPRGVSIGIRHSF